MDKMWAIVEIMGHSRIAGEISEEEIAGTKMLRVDVPATENVSEFTKFYGATAIYAITPTDETTARLAVQSFEVEPVSPYIFRVVQAELTASDDEGELDPIPF